MQALFSRTYPGAGLAVVRLMVGVVFIFHGAQKLFGWFGGGGIAGTAGFFETLGLPMPTVSAYAAGGAEFFGGLALLAGVAWRPAAAALVVTMLVASFSAHSGFSGQTGGMEYPLTLAMVTLGIGLAGPGAWTLPALLSGSCPAPAPAAT